MVESVFKKLPQSYLVIKPSVGPAAGFSLARGFVKVKPVGEWGAQHGAP